MTDKKLVVVVDMQNDFMDFEDSNLPIPGSSEIIPAVNRYITRELKPSDIAAVVFTQDWHNEDHVEYDPDGNPFPKHCVKETKGAELCVMDGSVPRPIPVVGLRKNMFDMWGEDDLRMFPKDSISKERVERMFNTPEPSRELFFEYWKKQGVTEVEVVGVALNICVAQAVRGFVNRGFSVTVRENLTRGIDVGGGVNDLTVDGVFKDIRDKINVT
jgi:nicotinamidase/pyrazinamidase